MFCLFRLCPLFLSLLLTIPCSIAQPTSYIFEFDTYDDAHGGADPLVIMHGAAAVPTGRLVQIIKTGTDTLLESPQTGTTTAGMVGTGNILSSTFAVGTGTSVAGTFDVLLTGIANAYTAAQIPTGSTFWARVWYDVTDRSYSYGAVSFDGKSYCDAGPFTCPAQTSNPYGNGPQVGNVQMIPSSASPSWHTITVNTAVISGEFSVPPTQFNIASTYPNPFNSKVTVVVGVPRDAVITVRIIDVLGREIDTIFAGSITTGHHRFIWNAEGYATGNYIVRIESEGVIKDRVVQYIR